MFDFKEIEEKAKEIWKVHEAAIAESIKFDKNKSMFSFLEGPPTANAPPGLHHLEMRTMKDLICKYKFMNGFTVPRKGGWDTHGLPVEVQVEKALGLKSKKEVIEYGMEKFIKKCRESVFSNIDDWTASTKELGYLVDLDNPYVTLDNDYIESVWWSLKELYNKDYLYEGFKVVPYCPRCGTPLSSHEVSQGYKNVKDNSLIVAFKVKGKNDYILAWTTTAWTLPGNVALAVGKDIDYVRVELPDGDFVILAKDRLEIMGDNPKVVDELKGSDLVGLSYDPLFDIKELQNDHSHKVISAPFVTTEDGTGVVHTAGMYGEDDYGLCKDNNLPLIHTVGEDGKFSDLVPKNLRGRFVKDLDVEIDIFKYLKEKHLLFKKEKFEHSYPFCWRCSTPLLYYAINSWFIATTKAKDKMIELNKKINWYPSHVKDGRFGKWLENLKDWNLSRFKFWGTPLPIWRCEDDSCNNEKIIGSVDELRKESGKELKEYDLHRPFVDNIKLQCSCGKEMTRIPDLIDVWYDSGSAPFAQFHYPFENSDLFDTRFPYDYIAEAVDQTRGWFYTMHAISTMLFDDLAYKNCICAGHILDEKGEKMSKSKGNIIKPDEIIPKVGVDAVRLQMCINDPGNSKRFSVELVKESVLPFLTVLQNCKRFYEQAENVSVKMKVEDEWIISKLNTLIKEATLDLENYALDKALEKIMNFTVQDFSRTYIKMTRDRTDTKEILGAILEKIALLLAPYAPYISEYIYSDFSKDSVHLSAWPKSEKSKINESLESMFSDMSEIIEKGLYARDKAQIGLKWPLSSATISGKFHITKELEEIVKSQLNVKSLKIAESEEELTVTLNTKLTKELEAEGFAREMTRKVQAARKNAKLIKTDEIELEIESEFDEMLKSHEDSIMHKVGARILEFGNSGKKFIHFEEGKVKGKEYQIRLNRL